MNTNLVIGGIVFTVIIFVVVIVLFVTGVIGTSDITTTSTTGQVAGGGQQTTSKTGDTTKPVDTTTTTTTTTTKAPPMYTRVEQDTKLTLGTEIYSPDKSTMFAFQTDRNICIYHKGDLVWAANTQTSAVCGVAMTTKGIDSINLILQADGNIVLYCAGYVEWSAGTDGKGSGGYNLQVYDDGNVYYVDSKGTVIWQNGKIMV